MSQQAFAFHDKLLRMEKKLRQGTITKEKYEEFAMRGYSDLVQRLAEEEAYDELHEAAYGVYQDLLPDSPITQFYNEKARKSLKNIGQSIKRKLEFRFVPNIDNINGAQRPPHGKLIMPNDDKYRVYEFAKLRGIDHVKFNVPYDSALRISDLVVAVHEWGVSESIIVAKPRSPDWTKLDIEKTVLPYLTTCVIKKEAYR